MVVCATDFSAVTDAFADFEWSGRDERPLVASSGTQGSDKAIWPDHRPRTFLGSSIPPTPNMFAVFGPHQPFGNIPRSREGATLMVADLLTFCKEKGYNYAEATQEAADGCKGHSHELGKAQVLVNEIDSWLTGVNTNVNGRGVRTVVQYTGSAVDDRKRLDEERKLGFQGIVCGEQTRKTHAEPVYMVMNCLCIIPIMSTLSSRSRW